MTQLSKTSKSTQRSKIPAIASISLLILLAGCYFLIPSVQEFFTEMWEVLTSNDETRIKNWVSGFGWLGPMVLILSMIVQMFLIIIPSVILMVVSIVAYGPIWGSLIVFLAIFSASSVGYFLGYYFGKGLVVKLLGEKSEQKIEGFIENYGFWAIVISRVNPFLSNDAISFVAGILKMSYWRFMAATMVGITPLTLSIAIIGEQSESLKTGLLWISVVSLLIFVGYIVWRKKKS